jgi:hypothetical protein
MVTWRWTEMGSPPPSPPVVTRVNPVDLSADNLLGEPRTFTASCDQQATMTFYLDGNPKHQSGPGVQQASLTCPCAPYGQHVVRVVAANGNGTGENYWNWNVYQEGGCHVPSGPYLDFRIDFNRSGLPDCNGGSGTWNEAFCLVNAVIRYARAGNSNPFIGVLEDCYWIEKMGCPVHGYVEEIFNLDIYIVSIMNGNLGFGHEVCAEYLGCGVNIFTNWKFFQYDNLQIIPGNYQMPYGVEAEDTKVEIYEVIGIPDCGHYDSEESPVVTFLIDENGNVTLG